MIFAARQLQEKCWEQNVGLFNKFVDLTKAFDTVCREGLWKIMAKFGCPAKFIAMVRQFHDGMTARVQDGGEYSEPFPVTNRLKQGCVLAPTLFSMVFSAMLSDAFRNGDIGVSFRYRTDGSLFTPEDYRPRQKYVRTQPATFCLPPGLGAPGPQARNHTESPQGSCSPVPALCMRDLDCLQPARQTTQCLPHEMSEDLFRIRWQDKVLDTEVLQRAESESIQAILLCS